MGPYAVISDIHGNLHALEAVLSRIETMGINDLICLGDIVGYGPYPGRCVDLVVKCCSTVVRGNHDDAVINPEREVEFNGPARTAIAGSSLSSLPLFPCPFVPWPLASPPQPATKTDTESTKSVIALRTNRDFDPIMIISVHSFVSRIGALLPGCPVDSTGNVGGSCVIPCPPPPTRADGSTGSPIHPPTA